jgi:LTXXQ motif family protein
MSKFKICVAVVLTTALMGAAYAAPGRGGGGGGRGGGGGAPHAMGGGGHFGGGGHIGGAAHFGGGARMGGGGAHFGGARIGGAPRFSGRPAISRFAARPGFRGQRSFAGHGNPGRAANRAAVLNSNRSAAFSRNHNSALGQNRSATARSNAVRNALSSRAVAGALHNRAALRNANARAQIVASAATAGWHNGRGGSNGWWRHRHGGYGWVGPLFWPFAYYDIYDYAMWGYGDDAPFWDYGYNDIYAGLFAPYGYDDLRGYLPPSGGGARVSAGPATGAPSATADQLAPMCGEDSRDIAGLPIDQIQQAIAPNDAQRAALDDLANASVKAAQDIKAACPTKIGVTAPDRLAAMQQRIEAMISAVSTVQPPLQKFYGLMNDDQKARLNALGQDQRRSESAQNTVGSRAQNCGAAQPGVTDWPTGEIEARLHPTDAQRASLAALTEASAKAADMLKASCQPGEAITPPARLEAVGKRLDTMLQAVKTVRAALDDFYGKLADEQKAQFEAIGPGRSASSDQPTAARTHVRRHHVGIRGIIRHFMSMARW